MFRILRGIVIVIVVFFLYSCEQEELKVPTQFAVHFNLDWSDENSDERFNVSNANIFLKSFELEGSREVGDDIYFYNEFNKAIQIDLLDNKTIDSLKYEVPQGVYNNIKIRFRLINTNDTAIIMKGVYDQIPSDDDESDESDERKPKGISNGKGKRHVLLKIDSELIVDINAKSAKKQQIVLKKENEAECAINLDLRFIQGVLNPGKIRNAETDIIAGKETVVISQDQNNEFYRLILRKIEKSFKARISS